jgi:hypothetical protein
MGPKTRVGFDDGWGKGKAHVNPFFAATLYFDIYVSKYNSYILCMYWNFYNWARRTTGHKCCPSPWGVYRPPQYCLHQEKLWYHNRAPNPGSFTVQCREMHGWIEPQDGCGHAEGPDGHGRTRVQHQRLWLYDIVFAIQHQINTRKLGTHQESQGNRMPCTTSVETLYVSRSTTLRSSFTSSTSVER